MTDFDRQHQDSIEADKYFDEMYKKCAPKWHSFKKIERVRRTEEEWRDDKRLDEELKIDRLFRDEYNLRYSIQHKSHRYEFGKPKYQTATISCHMVNNEKRGEFWDSIADYISSLYLSENGEVSSFMICDFKKLRRYAVQYIDDFDNYDNNSLLHKNNENNNVFVYISFARLMLDPMARGIVVCDPYFSKEGKEIYDRQYYVEQCRQRGF